FGNRIRKRRHLSIPRSGTLSLSRIDGCGFQGAVLRRKHPGQLSVAPGSSASEAETALKMPDRWKWEELRHRLVFTPEEKRVISFVIAALLLGLGTKCYRDTHPQPPEQVDKKHSHTRTSQP